MPRVDKRALLRFSRYTAVGVSTFALDLALLFALIDWFGFNYLLATGFAFWFAVSLNYLLSRTFAFVGTERPLLSGYGVFLKFALGAVGLIVGLMWLLVDIFGLSYILSRIAVAAAVGFGNYLLNLYLNFRVAGHDI